VLSRQVQNERKTASLIRNESHAPGNVKHVPTGHEDSEEGGGVDGGEVGPAAFAEDAANNEEDAANTTADSQDGDDDVHSEHHKPYGGDDKAQEDAHHKAALMLGVSADLDHQNAAQNDPQDPGKNKRPPGRPKGAKDSRPRTRRRKAEISAIRNATAAGMPVGMGMGFPHHQVRPRQPRIE
jgi:hypothetical protein